MKHRKLNGSLVLLISLFTALQPSISSAQTVPADDDDFQPIVRPSRPAPAPAVPASRPAPQVQVAPPAPPTPEEIAAAAAALAEQQRIRQEQARADLEQQRIAEEQRRLETERQQIAYAQRLEQEERERAAEEQQRIVRQAEEARLRIVAAEANRAASYGPQSRLEPGLLLSSNIGLGNQHAGTGANGFSVPLIANLTLNDGRHHLQGSAASGVSNVLGFRASADYAVDLGNPRVIVGAANSDRVQGQMQFLAHGLFTLGMAAADTAPFNSISGGAGVGYSASGRTRVNYVAPNSQSGSPVLRGMLRPRATIAVGTGTQSPTGGQGFAGLSLGVDGQLIVPATNMGQDYIVTAELAGTVQRGFNFIDSDSNLLMGSSTVGACIRPRTGQQNFQGGCLGLQAASQSLGNNGSSYVGLTAGIDWDFIPNGNRRVASDAPRTPAARSAANPTPHPSTTTPSAVAAE